MITSGNILPVYIFNRLPHRPTSSGFTDSGRRLRLGRRRAREAASAPSTTTAAPGGTYDEADKHVNLYEHEDYDLFHDDGKAPVGQGKLMM